MGSTSKAIRNNLSYLVRGMRSSMVRHLGEWIDPPRIDRVLEQFERSLDSKINSLDTYALKQRTSDNVLDDFLAEFERRLALSAKRVPERLAVLTAAEDAEKVNRLKHAILMEVLRRPGSFLAEATTDPELASIDPDVYVPGYAKLSEQIHERTKFVRSARRDREQKQRIERRRQKYEQEYLDPVVDANVEALSLEPLIIKPPPSDPVAPQQVDAGVKSGQSGTPDQAAGGRHLERIWWVLAAAGSVGAVMAYRMIVRRSAA